MSYNGFNYMEDEKYLAKPVAMMYFESGNKKTPGFKVAFAVQTEEGIKRIDWNGWLSEGARKRTLEIVVNLLGWDGNEENTDEDGVFGEGSIDTTREVNITVKYNDKGYPEVQWVNSLGGAKFAGAQPVQARKGMQMLGLKAEFLALKKNSGQQVPKQQQQKKDADLPF